MASLWCVMTRKTLRRTRSDRLSSQIDEEFVGDDLYETDLERASSACYERRRKMWVEFNQGADWWIIVAAYLILSSVAALML